MNFAISLLGGTIEANDCDGEDFLKILAKRARQIEVW